MNSGVIRDVAFARGRRDLAWIDGVVAAAPPDGAREFSGSGYVAVPRLADAHVHLDKPLLGPRWLPHRSGRTIPERIQLEIDALSSPDMEDVYLRGERLLRLAVANGSTRIRSHVDISARLGLSRLIPLLALREAYRDVVDLTFVAFPQEGILSSPGTSELLDEALSLGVEAIGGLDPITRDGDMEGHLDIVFGLATKHQVRIDIHLHDPGTAGTMTMREIALRTASLGMHGKVAISHGYGLGTVEGAELERTVCSLAGSGVSLISNVPGKEPRPPYDVLLDFGVNLVLASDNVRDSWSPYGKADMLERVALAGYLNGWNDDERLLAGLDLVTSAAAITLGDKPALLRPGDAADFTLASAACLQEAIVSQPASRMVFRQGCVVAQNGLVAPALVHTA